MTAHARLSPSGAHCWSHCTASVRAVEEARASGRIPPDESSAAADEGTAAHQVREECLSLGLDPYDFVGGAVEVNGRLWPISEQVAEALQPGIDWIRERCADDSRMLLEHRVALDPWLPGQFGTIDCAFWWQPDGTATGPVEIVLSDFKNGFVDVEAERNPQQMIYALGYLAYADTMGIVDSVRICIDQPNRGGLKIWTCSKAELLEFGDWIAERGREALGPSPVFRPGIETCRWCPLAFPGGCPARDSWMLDDVLGVIDDLDDLDAAAKPPSLPAVVTPERRGYLIEHTPTIIEYLRGLKAESYAAAMAGQPDPGMKLVLGDQGDRTWVDADAAEEILEDAVGDGAYAPRKIISYPQAEKLLKPRRGYEGHFGAWERLKANMTRAPAQPVLVPASHKKPEYRPSGAIGDVSELEELD